MLPSQASDLCTKLIGLTKEKTITFQNITLFECKVTKIHCGAVNSYQMFWFWPNICPLTNQNHRKSPNKTLQVAYVKYYISPIWMPLLTIW